MNGNAANLGAMGGNALGGGMNNGAGLGGGAGLQGGGGAGLGGSGGALLGSTGLESATAGLSLGNGGGPPNAPQQGGNMMGADAAKGGANGNGNTSMMRGIPVEGNPDWSGYTAPDGRTYYYNATTGVSSWEKPAAAGGAGAASAPATSAAPVNVS